MQLISFQNKILKNTLSLVILASLVIPITLSVSAQSRLQLQTATEQEALDVKSNVMTWGKKSNSNLVSNPAFNTNTPKQGFSLSSSPREYQQPNFKLQNVGRLEMVPTSGQELQLLKSQKPTLENVPSISQIITNSNSVTQTVTSNNGTDNDGFNPGLAVNNQTLYSLPDNFGSADKIRQFLKDKKSFLANYQVDLNFESDDDVLDRNPTLRSQIGQKVDFAEMVWRLARTELGNNCTRSGICVNNSQKPINPAFILGMIQRESGLIYGPNARLNPNSEEAKFLLDRTTGFLCNETGDKSKSCWDQNPDWKYYKGLFRQTFYMIRNLNLNAKRCENDGVNVYGKTYKVGATVTHTNRTFVLENGMTCALYIYTPHTFAQRSLFKTMNYIDANIGSYGSSSVAQPLNNDISTNINSNNRFKLVPAN
jgi:hypothetical protein